MRRFFRSIAPVVIIAIAAVAATPAEATQLVISATANFPTSFSAFTDNSTKQFLYFDNGGVASAPVSPFNALLGTLDKVNIDWDFGGSFSGTTGSTTGSVGFSFGGQVYVNSISYNGSGNGNGNGADPYSALTVSLSNTAIHNEFLPSSTPIWTALSGLSPYTVSFNTGTGSYSNYTAIASGTLSTYRNVVVSYTYTAAPSSVPEIDPNSLGSVLALVAGALGLLERRRLKAAWEIRCQPPNLGKMPASPFLVAGTFPRASIASAGSIHPLSPAGRPCRSPIEGQRQDGRAAGVEQRLRAVRGVFRIDCDQKKQDDRRHARQRQTGEHDAPGIPLHDKTPQLCIELLKTSPRPAVATRWRGVSTQP